MRSSAHKFRRAGLVIFLLSTMGAINTDTSLQVSVERVQQTPLISPSGKEASAGAFNPAAVRRGKEIILLYREQDAKGTSRIGYASSKDGIHFKTSDTPVLSPEAPYEKDGGVEDPRVVKLGDTFYMTYTGYNKKDAQLCLATSADLIHWTRKGILLPAYQGKWNVGWTKSGAIFQERINGKYWMYYLGTGPDKRDYMGIASSEDLLHWADASDRPVLPRIPGAWDSRVMEPGPPPIMIEKGILLIYNGADDKLVYSTGWSLFDKHDPAHLLARSERPFIKPELEWERDGQVPNVIFTEGLIRDGNDLLLYYGGADKYIGGMRVRIKSHGP